MKETKFFRVSGLASVAHTPETEKKWQSWGDYDCSKSDLARDAVIKYAKSEGFDSPSTEGEYNIDIAKKAFSHLLSQFPKISGKIVSGAKSFIIRNAIINYS